MIWQRFVFMRRLVLLGMADSDSLLAAGNPLAGSCDWLDGPSLGAAFRAFG
jgi:hypothetical protein